MRPHLVELARRSLEAAMIVVLVGIVIAVLAEQGRAPVASPAPTAAQPTAALAVRLAAPPVPTPRQPESPKPNPTPRPPIAVTTPAPTPPGCCRGEIGTAMIGGIFSHMGSAPVGKRYLATPYRRGTLVRICGSGRDGRCRTMRTVDRGPSLKMQRQGRIADLSVFLFELLCGKPASAGLCRGSIEVLE